jgi:hypothetical protein
MEDMFDFGFTAVDEDELQAVQQTAAKADDAEQLATTTQNRLEKIEELETKLQQIYKG